MIKDFKNQVSYYFTLKEILKSNYLAILVLFKLLKYKLTRNNRVIKERISVKTIKWYPEIWIRPLTSDLNFMNKIINCESYKLPVQINPDHIIDCGANIGLTSLYFAYSFPNTRIISIEPEEDNYNLLVKNIKSFSDRITPLKGAIWYESIDKLSLVNPEDRFNTVGFFVGNKAAGDSDGYVRGITINDIMREYNIPFIDILKLDIEGAEMILFEKSDLSFVHSTKMIIIEIHHDSDGYKKKYISERLAEYSMNYLSLVYDNHLFIR